VINKECGVVVISGEHIFLMGDMETCRARASSWKVVTMVVERITCHYMIFVQECASPLSYYDADQCY